MLTMMEPRLTLIFCVILSLKDVASAHFEIEGDEEECCLLCCVVCFLGAAKSEECFRLIDSLATQNSDCAVLMAASTAAAVGTR